MSRSDVLDNSSVLTLGARGRLRRRGFTLSGRTCVRSTAGAVWNEWTVAFDDGHKAHLAEARGEFVLYEEGPLLPPWDAPAVGGPLGTGYVVVERGEARRVRTWGDATATPKAYRYLDLSSASGASATIDFGERAPKTYVGRAYDLATLGLSLRSEPPTWPRIEERPTPRGVDLLFAPGDEGEFDGERYRVTAILHRSVRTAGKRYTWEEYVLCARTGALRWLVASDGRFSFVKSVAPGRVGVSSKSATFEGVTYKPLSSGRTRLEWATGALPWTVTIGETSESADYRAPPLTLSRESTADEISWSLGTTLSASTVARAFGARVSPKRRSRTPKSPSSTRPKR